MTVYNIFFHWVKESTLRHFLEATISAIIDIYLHTIKSAIVSSNIRVKC